jgi:uncharacterized protein
MWTTEPVTGPARFQYVNAMKFHLDQTSTINVVRGYDPGVIRIGDHEFSRSLIVTATTLIEDWRPLDIGDLQAADLEPVLQLRPEVLLIGSGTRQVFPDRATLAALYSAGLGFEIMDTGAACRTYNVLVAEGREVAAALILEPRS